MQVDNKLIDDIARVAGGALGTLAGVRQEAEARVKEVLERMLAGMDMVTRDEFEAVQAMAAKARMEQESLLERVDAVEQRLAALEAKPKRRTATRKKAAGEKIPAG